MKDALLRPLQPEVSQASPARADAVTDKIGAELRLRERVPDHPPRIGPSVLKSGRA